MEDDEHYAPISALQHLLVCERQAALIHLERIWVEDAATASGRLLHARVDRAGEDSRRGVRVIRGLRLVSHRLRLVGRADAVELHDKALVPVEYKRGGGRFPIADAVQLAAQAICLEEMRDVRIPVAAIYLSAKHRRREVQIDDELRGRVVDAAARVHQMLRKHELPAPVLKPVCRKCSLEPVCMPWALRVHDRGGSFIGELLREED